MTSKISENQGAGLPTTTTSGRNPTYPTQITMPVSNQSITDTTIERDVHHPTSVQGSEMHHSRNLPSEIPRYDNMPPGIPRAYQGMNLPPGIHRTGMPPGLTYPPNNNAHVGTPDTNWNRPLQSVTGLDTSGPMNPSTGYYNQYSSMGALPTAPYPDENLAGFRFPERNFDAYQRIKYWGSESASGSANNNHSYAPVSAQAPQSYQQWWDRSQRQQLQVAGEIITGQGNQIAQLKGELAQSLADNREQTEKIERQADMIRNLRSDVAEAQEAFLKLQEFLNIRGGIEKIVDVGKKGKHIPAHSGNGNQAAIDALAGTTEFKTALEEESASRVLKDTDILPCLSTTYHQLSKYAHRTTGHLTLDHRHHLPAEIAALVTILRAQSTWGSGITWEEVGLQARESTQN